jgi:hypothetical protein
MTFQLAFQFKIFVNCLFYLTETLETIAIIMWKVAFPLPKHEYYVEQWWELEQRDP